MSSIQEANSERHYIQLVIAIIIGLVGIYLRFFDFKHASLVANIILIIGAGITFKTLYNILK